MTPTTEKGLVNVIRREIKRAYPGHWSLKTHGNPYQDQGLPDLLLCIESLMVGMEVKHIKPGETRDHAILRVTPGQALQIMAINDAGGIAGVVTSAEEALDLIVRGFIKQAHIVAQREKELSGDG